MSGQSSHDIERAFADQEAEKKEQESTDPPEGITLYTADGTPVKVVLMDEHDDRLQLCAHPEQGVWGYQSADTTITMFLEEP